MHDIEQIRPSSSGGIFLEPAVTSIPPEKIETSDSPIMHRNSVTKEPYSSLELSSLALFGPGMIKPTHHLKSVSKTETKERRLEETAEHLTVTIQGLADPTSFQAQQSDGSSAGGDTGGIILDERPSSRLTDIDV